MPFRLLVFLLCFSNALTPREKALNVESFEVVWKTVRDRHPDRTLNGLDWQAVHDTTKPLVEKAESIEEARAAMRGMLAKLGASHYAIIPKERYEDAGPAPVAVPKSAAPDAPAVKSMVTGDAPMVSVQPKTAEPDSKADSKNVTFGNLPETRLEFEAKRLAGGAGYIRFNEFLDPVSIMPKVEAAVQEFSAAPGIVLDLRGNRGGIGIMAMGIAGFFVSEPGRKLGDMVMADATLKFVIFPRPLAYKGKLAILVDGGSASTTEILAQGMQDLGRARIFGTLTAGAALPSDIVRLPNGDGFQFAEASYTSVSGKVLEGSGVTPDVEVRETAEAREAGRDLVVEAAEAWIRTAVK